MMPTMKLKQISKTQPMREGEVAVVDYLNGDLTEYLAQETNERIAGINEFKGKVETEQARAEAAEGKLTSDLAAEVTERKAKDVELEGRLPIKADDIKDGAVGPTKLDTTILTQLGKLDSLPLLEYGLTPSFSVEASSHADITITYASPKATVPILVCSVVCQTNVLACTLAQVSTAQAIVRVDNVTTTKIDNVSIAWSLISRG